MSPVGADVPPSLTGTPVVPGVALGPVLHAVQQLDQDVIAEYRRRPAVPAEEALATYDAAVAEVAERLLSRSASASGATSEVLVATAGLVKDKGLRGAVRKRLQANEDLVGAVTGSVEQFVDLFTQAGGLMAERVTDLRDIERRVVAHILGVPEPGIAVPTEPSVLVAEDLAPADTAGLDASRVVALVTEGGGPTSHTAIIARQLGMPCVVGAAGVTRLQPGTPVLVDGMAGTIDVDPDPAEAERWIDVDRASRAAQAAWSGPGTTRDGRPVKLLANVADGASARVAADAPVEGVGLFRTELCFLDTAEEPSVQVQAEVYAEVLRAFAEDQHVVVRTLDAGSDKPIAYATPAHEGNPALGVRGLRLSFDDASMLDRQIEAIARAAQETGVRPWVMAPMVATVAEAEDFVARVHRHGLRGGVMVEVPSAALLADRMLEVADFLSIGTNDLTQYTMAADRLASGLAHLSDPWQPAVLHLVALAARAGQRAGKPVGVCGEAAADPTLAPVLIGLGITSLSMAPAAVRAVGAQLERVTGEQCEQAARAALDAPDPDSARAAVRVILRGEV
ncbi:phosphoenolpyruvate--protein phosphotransferase [Janibacter sp. GS2]|uniref:phosphoenolpyruvate--protein phosphotransferase n=1 Tax=Janibacter sp. GS2 TaxID=3442646 RepID=UPI003EC09F84